MILLPKQPNNYSICLHPDYIRFHLDDICLHPDEITIFLSASRMQGLYICQV